MALRTGTFEGSAARHIIDFGNFAAILMNKLKAASSSGAISVAKI